MKKYNTPEIEALALETIDVIATSGHEAAEAALTGKYDKISNIGDINNTGATGAFDTTWSW